MLIEWVKASSYSMLSWPFFGVWFERLLVWYILLQCLDCILGSPLEGNAQHGNLFVSLIFCITENMEHNMCPYFLLRVSYCCCKVHVLHTRNKHSDQECSQVCECAFKFVKWVIVFCYIILCILGWFLL